MKPTDLVQFSSNLNTFCHLFHDLFAHPKPPEIFDSLMLGFMMGARRKNGWELAHLAGHHTPHRIHNFFTRTIWDADEAMGVFQDYVISKTPGPCALLFDETGFLKKGPHSVGVKRQYSGTAGRNENCQLGVFAALVTPRAHMLWARRLLMPKEWCDDQPRRDAAHVPIDLVFKTKAELALEMFEATLARGVTPKWVGGDCAYGDDTSLRARVAESTDYVFAVSNQTQVWEHWPLVELAEEHNATHKDKRRYDRVAAKDHYRRKVSEIAAQWEPERWVRKSQGQGSKGEREYEWAWCDAVEGARIEGSRQMPSRRSLLLVRQRISEPESRAYFLCHGHQERPVEEWIERAGTRWAIEQCFEEGKELFGLDEYEVRRWEGWHRHITMSMMAHGFVALERARMLEEEEQEAARQEERKKSRRPSRAAS